VRHQGRARGRQEVHRGSRALQPPRERRRREEPGDTSGDHDALPAHARAAEGGRDHAGARAPLDRHRAHRRHHRGYRQGIGRGEEVGEAGGPSLRAAPGAFIVKERIELIPRFELESGETLEQVPVAYRSWGRLAPDGKNVVVVCHALTGSADIEIWWPRLLGPGRALDTERYFIVCANVLGSPYGTASPLTIDPATGRPYGPDFPVPTIRDTVALHRLLLERLGVRRVEFVIGGSMGGMQALEWAFHGDFVRGIVPIGVGGRHSAWCIGWS